MAARRTRTPDEGSITVKIQPVFGEVKEFRVPEDSTVGEVLEAADYPASTEVRVNSEGVLDKDTIVEDGDRLTIVAEGKIKNG